MRLLGGVEVAAPSMLVIIEGVGYGSKAAFGRGLFEDLAAGGTGFGGGCGCC